MGTRILTSAELRRIEADFAMVEPPLMQRAGAAAAALAREMLANSALPPLIVAGPGNNGGDAFVVARELKAVGYSPRVLFAADAEQLPADARRAYLDWRAIGGECLASFPPGEFGLIIDGLFGMGLSRPIEGLYAEWIERINAGATAVLALDVPSGLNADTGTTTGPCVFADRTATFIALKPGLLTGDGPDYCGAVTLCTLGLDIGERGGQSIEPQLFAGCLKPRRKNSHKGDYGNVCIIGGAPGMSGAALLAGRAALKLGAGRVYLGMLERLAVDPTQPELMLRAPEEALEQGSVLAIGPGLGQSMQASELLVRAIGTSVPLVIDADGLNLLTQGTLLMRRLAARREAVPRAPTLLTPHPAEAARLLGTTTAQVQADRLAAALALAQKFSAYVALKGCGTIVATPDGRWFINTSGNPGLASAGSGDVLTGMIAALLAQQWPPLEALLAAVHLHGAAAEACAAHGEGPVGLTAGELIASARRILNGWIAAQR
ncbi:MAG: NAD(P)H-hydrate dehydratase [Rhodocyclaceae bacterium]|nr:NAD(P)H-hydrate dehydratase [Rhodocyclaceae bacterium]